MKFRFINVTGRTSLTNTLATANLVIDNSVVRPEEERHFDVPTSDICAAMIAKSISVSRNRGAGSWVPVSSLADFTEFSILQVITKQRVQTVDGFRFSEVTSFDISHRIDVSEVKEDDTDTAISNGDDVPGDEIVDGPHGESNDETVDGPDDEEGNEQWSGEVADETDSVEPEITESDATEEDTEEAPVVDEPTEETTETTSTVRSLDFNAKDAVAYIKATDAEALVGFLSDEESRTSVLAAWEDKK